MDKSSRLEEQWYSVWSSWGRHQFVNELGNAYFDEGYVDSLEEGFEKAGTFLDLKLATTIKNSTT